MRQGAPRCPRHHEERRRRRNVPRAGIHMGTDPPDGCVTDAPGDDTAKRSCAAKLSCPAGFIVSCWVPWPACSRASATKHSRARVGTYQGACPRRELSRRSAPRHDGRSGSGLRIAPSVRRRGLTPMIRRRSIRGSAPVRLQVRRGSADAHTKPRKDQLMTANRAIVGASAGPTATTSSHAAKQRRGCRPSSA